MHAQTVGVPEARRVELMRSALLELLPAAMAPMERRMTAGTLLAGACRPYEMAWCATTQAHADAVAANIMPNAAERARCSRSAAELSAWSAYVGYDAYMLTAMIALKLCALGTPDTFTAQTLNLQEATAVACSVFVESAFDMIHLRTTTPATVELDFVRNAQIYIDKEKCFHASSSSSNNEESRTRILSAWHRLQSSGVLQRRGILQGMSVVTAHNTHATATAAATAAARGLRFCALHTCGAQEVHASHFKRCSACLGVVYCCKEHQVQGWPAHKAACRAARKAAEQPIDEASGA
jgi:hypothetical protein